MKKILLCQHNGSANHGSEALARATAQMLLEADSEISLELYSYRRGDDEKYLGDIPGLKLCGPRQQPGKYSLHNLVYLWRKRVLRNANAPLLPLTEEFRRAVKNADAVIAIGGDNYCQRRGQDYYEQDEYIKAQGKPYVLLGASVQPADLPSGLARHLQVFDLITAGERLSYQAMRDYGLTQTALCADAAFLLPAEQTRLPNGFEEQNTVGINISPAVLRHGEKDGMALENFRGLVKYILDNTQLQVALIPYAVTAGEDDRTALQQLKQDFADNARVFMVADTGARELKYIISQLRFFVGAHAHAAIAAYSGLVPTLVVGDSPKARGIALDLFDEGERYILPAASLNRPEQLQEAFAWLMEQEQQIKQRLENMMPAYQGLAAGAALYLQRVLAGKEVLIPGAPILAPKSRCTGCGLCAQVCTEGAIRMEADAEGFFYPQTDAELCQKCGQCGQACPAMRPRRESMPMAYAAKLIDEKTRLASSSGGVFTPLALDLLRHGGYVCGAAYDGELNVQHIIIDNEKDLPQLRGSKYAPSDLSAVYAPIQQILEAQRPLLFTGTPCQTAAIRALCGDHDYLLTAAVVCHGVPSPLVFRKYIGEMEKQRGLRAVEVNFKNKENGWRHAQTVVRFGGGAMHSEPNRDSAFMRAFLKNLCLRPSCHDCFAKANACADLLIGDYWGIEDVLPDFADDMGVSVVLSLSDKGQAALNGASGQMHVEQTSPADAWRHNPAMVSSAPCNEHRAEFFAALDDKPLAELVQQFAPSSGRRKKV